MVFSLYNTENQTIPFQGCVPSEMEDLTGLYNRRSWSKEVSSFKRKTLYLTGRQVPSCLALSNLGTRISRLDAVPLKEAGFPLLEQNTDGDWMKVNTSRFPNSAVSAGTVSVLQSLLEAHVEENSLLLGDPSDDSSSSSGSSVESDYVSEAALPTGRYRFDYADPFKMNAIAYQLALDGQSPRVLSWPGGVKQLHQSIPSRALGPDWKGNMKRGIPFFKIADVNVQMHVLLRHTHWGKLLQSMASPRGTNIRFARSLIGKIRSFLKGFPNPLWNKDRLKEVYGADSDVRSSQSRSHRLIQVLCTIDGLFVQIYLSDVRAGWDWSKFDLFVLRSLSFLLDDEFYDGETLVDTTETHYELLKQYRGSLKKAVLRSEQMPLPLPGTLAEVFTGPVVKWNQMEECEEKVLMAAVLTQTRGCGTPPPLVVLKSKKKFLLNVSVKPEPLDDAESFLIKAAVEEVLRGMPDSAFSGLHTKAGIRTSSNACYEVNKADGGTTESIRKLVLSGQEGRTVKTYDLNDPSLDIEWKTLGELTEGEYVFWRCLEEVLHLSLEELREAKLVMIREPGKARTVTKARAPLKIVLDVVSGICSYPLKVGLESSSSGMGKSHHGWNFFKEFYGSWKDITFDVESSRSDSKYGGSSFKSVTTYKDVFVACTDYEEATDNMHHEVAQIIGEAWMSKCGIPAMLTGVVLATCFQPRTIRFDASGTLLKVGTATDNVMYRYVVLERGVLMGDPLTKVILHLVNASVRETMRMGTSNSFLNAFPELHPLYSSALKYSQSPS